MATIHTEQAQSEIAIMRQELREGLERLQSGLRVLDRPGLSTEDRDALFLQYFSTGATSIEVALARICMLYGVEMPQPNQESGLELLALLRTQVGLQHPLLSPAAEKHFQTLLEFRNTAHYEYTDFHLEDHPDVLGAAQYFIDHILNEIDLFLSRARDA